LYETSIHRFRAISEKSLRYMVALVLPGVVSLFILAHRFILLLFDRSYTASIPVFQVMVWVLLFRFVNSYLSFMLFAQGKQQRSLHVILIASVVYVPVTLVFVPTWGVVGMAMALLVSQGVAFVWYLAFAVSVPRVPTVLLSFARAALPSVGVGVLVWFLRPYPLAVITLVSIALYAVLFMALHIPDSEDIAVVRDLSVRAWHKTNARLRLVGGQ
jgi:O-antigen/teichoic acid export membrane protein